jgi:hypothetical protein
MAPVNAPYSWGGGGTEGVAPRSHGPPPASRPPDSQHPPSRPATAARVLRPPARSAASAIHLQARLPTPPPRSFIPTLYVHRFQDFSIRAELNLNISALPGNLTGNYKLNSGEPPAPVRHAPGERATARSRNPDHGGVGRPLACALSKEIFLSVSILRIATLTRFIQPGISESSDHD